MAIELDQGCMRFLARAVITIYTEFLCRIRVYVIRSRKARHEYVISTGLLASSSYFVPHPRRFFSSSKPLDPPAYCAFPHTCLDSLLASNMNHPRKKHQRNLSTDVRARHSVMEGDRRDAFNKDVVMSR